ncbi:DUF6508 domain-containing protein [uncultured Clostridium sp.]|uniref:DUF6508 domain-containing protein n=1 Tax=uncultured Clostridium sp. TaxID=59620 RepID=UPI0025E96C61|nr:DUF6508 domain-containing protein [uncultured Clostridium sp.]
MDIIEKIKFYIDYFSNKNNIFYESKNNAFYNTIIRYSSTIIEFVDFVYEINLIDNNYKNTINIYHENYSKLYELADISDIKLSKALLTYYIKEEKVCKGLIASAIYYNVFEKVLYNILPYLAWDKIINRLGNKTIEFETIPTDKRKHSWFSAKRKNNFIVIDCANKNIPSCKLTKKRKLIFKDFEKSYYLYLKIKNGEIISNDEKKSTINKSYFFSLIYNLL